MGSLTGRAIDKLGRPVWRALASTRLAIALLAGLGFLIAVGSLVPQLPAAVGDSARATWIGLAQQKYGSLYAPLRSLGLFELYSSPAFTTLAAALVVNGLLCTINRLGALGRMISRQRPQALGSLITHVALLAFLLSLALLARSAWQEDAVALATGQTRSLGHAQALQMRNDGLRMQNDAQGHPVSAASQVTVLTNGQEKRTASVQMNRPLRVGGIGVWLLSYQPGVRVRALSQEGQALALEGGTGGEESGQATFNLSEGPALVRVPAMDLELQVVAAPAEQVQEAYYLQVLRTGSASPVLALTVSADQEVQVNGIRLTVRSDPYAIFRIKSEPGLVPALLSLLALVAGITLAFLPLHKHAKPGRSQHTPVLIVLVAATIALALVATLAVRGWVAQRWPLGTPFEFTLAFAASALLLYLAAARSTPEPRVGAVTVAFALLLVLQAWFVQPASARSIQPLPPVMQGPLFALHTLLTSLAYGALAIGGGAALLRLATRVRSPQDSSVSELASVDRAMAIGYVALSLGMIVGAVWGEQAWAEPWTWSVKEAWTLVTWLVCTLYFHVRRRHGWRGRGAALLAVLALASVLVTFFLTPTIVHWIRLQPWRIY